MRIVSTEPRQWRMPGIGSVLLWFALLIADTGHPEAQSTNSATAFGDRLPLALPISGYGLVPALGGLQFTNPVAIVSPPGEIDRLFVVERAGRIMEVTNLRAPTAQLFLDLSSNTYSDYLETGLLGLAFHPGFQTNGYFFVYRSLVRSTPGNVNALHQQVSRFQTAPDDPHRVLPGSERVLIAQVDNDVEHNAGDLAFGPDGYLYISFGDAAPPPRDVTAQAQPVDNGFFGGIARIDVDQRAGSLAPNPGPATSQWYSIPPDNPFVGITKYNGAPVNAATLRTEWYAVGFRNPWRMSFDSATGRLFCGDVGASAWEEVNLVKKGGHYGWPYLEGNVGVAPPNLNPIAPLFTYPHGFNAQEGQAVMGGIVYRGPSIPSLQGAYVFGDYGAGNIWALRLTNESAGAWQYLTADRGVAAFGVDPSNGDVLIVNHTTGLIHRLVYAAPQAGAIPQTLEDTGLFSDLSMLQVQPGLTNYTVNVPFWSDGALKSRWFALPETGEAIQVQADGSWQFPPGSVWVKHFDLLLTNGVESSRHRLETRVLVKTADGMYGLTYRWGTALTNAVLVPTEGLDETFLIRDGGSVRTQVWHYPSRDQCLFCHTPQAGYALGFNAMQLNLGGTGDGSGNQLDLLKAAGCFANPQSLDPSRIPKLVPVDDLSYPLPYRARSYFQANCAQCHQPGAPAEGTWDARLIVPLADANIINGHAAYDLDNTFGLPIRILAPHSVGTSMIIQWMNRRGGAFQMPPMGTELVDSNAVDLITQWVNSFPPDPWRDVIFGATNTQGYATGDGRAFLVSTSGDGNHDAIDSRYFLYAPLLENGQVIAQLPSFSAASPLAKAGLMGRVGLDEQSPFVAIVQSGDGLAYFERRAAPGADAESIAVGAATNALWLRLGREAGQLTAYFSPDRENWTAAGSLDLTGNPTIYLGPAAAPGDSVAFSTAMLTNLDIISISLGTPNPGANFVSPGEVSLSANATSVNGNPINVQFLAGAQSIGKVLVAPYAAVWKDPTPGSYLVRASAADVSGAAVSSESSQVSVTLAGSAAEFHQADSKTQGNWIGVYGKEGYAIPGQGQLLPSAVGLDLGGAQAMVQSETIGAGALEWPGSTNRIASNWSSTNQLTLELQLNDARLYQIALYFLNPDGTAAREEQVHLIDASTGNLLATQTVQFSSTGTYLTWLVRGRIKFQIDGDSVLPAILSGLFLDPAVAQPPAIVLHPLAFKRAQLPASLTLQADATEPGGAISRVEFYDGTTFLGASVQFPYQFTWSDATVGVHTLTARAVDTLENYTDSPPQTVEFDPAAPAAEFLGIDPVTQGNWIPRYDRYEIAGLTTNNPPELGVHFLQGDVFVWDYPALASALQSPTNDWRIAACWFGNDIQFELDSADGSPHTVALYILDWDSGGRIESVSFLDAGSTNVLDSRTVSDLGSGVYYLWSVQGSVRVDIQPQIMDAVLSGLFFEPNPAQPLVLNWVPAGMALRGPPNRQIELNFSTDLSSWQPWATNTIPASGILILPTPARRDAGPGFYQATLLP
jgi:glucose/arabinose dehydrogenase/mono/diheme cytochrome c family protein